jgi:RHS repeat-associated protein
MEFQDELGLNLYDMDFRDYDPAIARWTGIDPVTHHNMSPYMAFDGNPVYWADPSGADSTDGNTLDIFGRDRFDSSGMYIPFGERGVGSFDEYLSQDGGGDGGGNSEIEAIFENALTGGIFIKFGGFLGLWTKSVQYVNGVLMKDGQLYTGKISNFVRSVLDALTTIGQKPIGLQLINAISNGPTPVIISRGNNKYLGEKGILWNPNDTSGGLDLNGSRYMPSYISLAHELAHNYDFRFDGRTGFNSQGDWFFEPKVLNAEIFAGNIENLIRQEHNLTQRAFYGIDQNGNGFGAYNTSLHLIINNIQDGRLY